MKKLNIYFTAGIPTLEDTAEIMKTIQNSGRYDGNRDALF